MFLVKRSTYQSPYGKKPFWKRKSTKVILIILAFIAVSATVITTYGYSQFSRIFTANFSPVQLFGILKNDAKLKGQNDGRINILLLGYGGAGHDGIFLTDTIQIASIDTKNNKIAFISIPRDLYVEIKKPEYYGKINAVYKTKNDGKLANKLEECNPDLIKKEIEVILGIPIQYYASVDFSGFKKAIDEYGGIDVTVDQSFTDYQYPADTGDGFLPAQTFKAGAQHMNGTKALIYARSRHAAGSEGSDFARSKRQQKVLIAFKGKLTEQGAMSNPSKLLSLVNIIGSSLRTDLRPDEIKSLALIIKQVDSNNTIYKVLGAQQDGLLVAMLGTSNFQPSKGKNDWTEIQQMAKNIFTDTISGQENARIEILNGSDTSGLALSLSDTLTGLGYNIVKIGKADITKTTVIYDYSNGQKPDTISFLKDRLKATVTKKSDSGTSDIVIIIGNDYQEKNGSFKESARK